MVLKEKKCLSSLHVSRIRMSLPYVAKCIHMCVCYFSMAQSHCTQQPTYDLDSKTSGNSALEIPYFRDLSTWCQLVGKSVQTSCWLFADKLSAGQQMVVKNFVKHITAIFLIGPQIISVLLLSTGSVVMWSVIVTNHLLTSHWLSCNHHWMIYNSSAVSHQQDMATSWQITEAWAFIV